MSLHAVSVRGDGIPLSYNLSGADYFLYQHNFAKSKSAIRMDGAFAFGGDGES